MQRSTARLGFGAGFIVLCLTVLVAAGSERRPNILFLISDDQRPDTIAALGNDIIETPNLDALVREGTSFTRAVCTNPICVASRAEILTGCSGFVNGILAIHRFLGTLCRRGWEMGETPEGLERF